MPLVCALLAVTGLICAVVFIAEAHVIRRIGRIHTTEKGVVRSVKHILVSDFSESIHEFSSVLYSSNLNLRKWQRANQGDIRVCYVWKNYHRWFELVITVSNKCTDIERRITEMDERTGSYIYGSGFPGVLQWHVHLNFLSWLKGANLDSRYPNPCSLIIAGNIYASVQPYFSLRNAVLHRFRKSFVSSNDFIGLSASIMHFPPSHSTPKNNRSGKQNDQVIGKIGLFFLFLKPMRDSPKPTHGWLLLICSFFLELFGVFLVGPIGGWTGVSWLKCVGMEVIESMSLRHFSRKYRWVEGGSAPRSGVWYPGLRVAVSCR